MELLLKGAATLGIHLGRPQVGQFRLHYEELVDWNSRVNLTSVTGWEEVQVRHYLDSLAVKTALDRAFPWRDGRFLDLGSGAGFPGLPLKIAFPEISLTLVDATGKKTAFLAHVTHALGLEGVDVRTGRAEDLAHDSVLREAFDVVVTRAVARLPVLAELTLAFCRLGGIVVAHKGPGVDEEVQQAASAMAAMGGALREIVKVSLEGQETPGVLVVLSKTSPTPDRYPRRPGTPARRPL